jgi:hypothetical protein
MTQLVDVRNQFDIQNNKFKIRRFATLRDFLSTIVYYHSILDERGHQYYECPSYWFGENDSGTFTYTAFGPYVYDFEQNRYLTSDDDVPDVLNQMFRLLKAVMERDRGDLFDVIGDFNSDHFAPNTVVTVDTLDQLLQDANTTFGSDNHTDSAEWTYEDSFKGIWLIMQSLGYCQFKDGMWEQIEQQYELDFAGSDDDSTS